MLSGLFRNIESPNSSDSLTDGSRQLPPTELRQNPTIKYLEAFLGEHHQQLLDADWYRSLLGYSIDNSPFSLIFDPTGSFSPVFDPHYFAPVLNPTASREELGRFGIMLVHDLAHLALGDMAPYTSDELREAEAKLLERDFGWRPERSAELEQAVREGYVRGLLLLECEAFLISHFVMPFTLGAKVTSELWRDNALARVIESGECTLEFLAENVRAFYENPDADFPVDIPNADVREVLHTVWSRARSDKSICEFRYRQITGNNTLAASIRPWCYLFLEGMCSTDNVDGQVLRSIKKIEEWQPGHSDNLYLINAYIAAYFRNGPMLREIVGGTDHFDGKEIYHDYQDVIRERDELSAAWRRGERPEAQIIKRVTDYPLPIPQRVPPLEQIEFPYLGRTIARAPHVITAIREDRRPLDFSFLVQDYLGAESGLFKEEVPLPRRADQMVVMLNLLNRKYSDRYTLLDGVIKADDDAIVQLARLESCIVGRPQGLPNLPDLLVYGFEQLGIVHALETESYRNFSTDPNESKIAILEAIAEGLLTNMVYRLEERGRGRTSFIALNPVLDIQFGNESSGLGERWRVREMQAAVGFWSETIVRPAMGVEDEASKEIASVLGRFAKSLASDIFRAYYVYGQDPCDYFADAKAAGQSNTDVSPLTQEESRLLREAMSVRYNTNHFKRGALSMLRDPSVHRAVSVMVREFNQTLAFGRFAYPTTYNYAFHRIASPAFKEITALTSLGTAVINYGVQGLNEWGARIGGSSVLTTGEYLLDHAEQTLEHIEAVTLIARKMSAILRHAFREGPGQLEAYRELARLSSDVTTFSPMMRMSLNEIMGVFVPVMGNWLDHTPNGPQTDPELILRLDSLSKHIGKLYGFSPDLVGRRFASSK